MSFKNVFQVVKSAISGYSDVLVDIEVPVDVDVAGFTTLTVEFSKDHFTTVAATLNAVDPDGAGPGTPAVTRKDATTVLVDLPRFGDLAPYQDSEYRVKRNGVVVGNGRLFAYRTAAKAARRRR